MNTLDHLEAGDTTAKTAQRRLTIGDFSKGLVLFFLTVFVMGCESYLVWGPYLYGGHALDQQCVARYFILKARGFGKCVRRCAT